MKAHPDFKWYKLPTPPVRTLITRPTKRTQQNERNSENCGITLGKLVDDEQLGGLSSLISCSTPGLTSLNTDSIDVISLSMAQKGIEAIAKPPKKRYLVNGEFQSHSESTPDDGQDCQIQDACSTLLEFAEICTSNAVRENATIALGSTEVVPSTTIYELSPSSSNKFSSISVDSSNSFIKFDLQKPEEISQKLPFTTSSRILQNNVCYKADSMFVTQEQPLDLCKNKDKNDVCVNSKTITTSHQQLIEHFVDKFLCAKPVPRNSYKSEFLDPVLSKLFSRKSHDVPCSSEAKVDHSSFTLSVAIESAVDKAYSSDYIKPSPTISSSSVLVDCIKNNTFESNSHLNQDTENCIKLDNENIAKNSEQNFESPSPVSHYKSKQMTDTLSSETNSAVLAAASSELSRKESVDKKISERSTSSKYFCKLVSPPKKSSVWCNLFMNEQLTKNDNESNSDISSNIISAFQSPTRRSSQRTCKGRRYQALITEGLLQSSKERKQSNSKKSVPPNSKVKTKVVSIIENHVFASKKKRKKESITKSESIKTETKEISGSIFNLEEKIASLPTCDFEYLNKKKKFILEESMNSSKQKKADVHCTISSTNSCMPSTDISEWTSTPSSGRYKTGNFDLEQHIASLPKCNIDVLNKKRKKEC